jgi:outer membrane immunogenic protein
MTYNNDGDDYYSTNTTKSGWLIGGGLEWGFTHYWLVRAEYYYIDYSSMNMKIPNIYGLYDPTGSAHINLNVNNVRLAINHWF